MSPLLAMSTATFFYIYILCVGRRAAYPKLIQFNARATYPKLIQFNVCNVYKIHIYSADATCSTMESYSNSSPRVSESSWNREDRQQHRRERDECQPTSQVGLWDWRRESSQATADECHATNVTGWPLKVRKREQPGYNRWVPTNITGWLLRLAVREARLQHIREGQRGQQPQLPLFEQPSVQANLKMQKFHAEIAALEMQKCTTCLEGFPGFAHTLLSVRASIAFELTLAPTMLCIHLVLVMISLKPHQRLILQPEKHWFHMIRDRMNSICILLKFLLSWTLLWYFLHSLFPFSTNNCDKWQNRFISGSSDSAWTGDDVVLEEVDSPLSDISFSCLSTAELVWIGLSSNLHWGSMNAAMRNRGSYSESFGSVYFLNLYLSSDCKVQAALERSRSGTLFISSRCKFISVVMATTVDSVIVHTTY